MDKAERSEMIRKRMTILFPRTVRTISVQPPRKRQPKPIPQGGPKYGCVFGILNAPVNDVPQWVCTPDPQEDPNVPHWRRIKRNSPLTEIAEKLKPGANALERWWNVD